MISEPVKSGIRGVDSGLGYGSGDDFQPFGYSGLETHCPLSIPLSVTALRKFILLRFQAVKKDVYDHHAAIYFLLQDKYNRAKLSLNKEQLLNSSIGRQQQQDHQQQQQHQHPLLQRQQQLQQQQRQTCRVPDPLSGIAEESLTAATTSAASASQTAAQTAQLPPPPLPLAQPPHPPPPALPERFPPRPAPPTTLWETEEDSSPSPSDPPSDLPQQSTAISGGMAATDHACLTCGLPILENTTSTTCCVKCARLRTRRRNFAHPNTGWRNQSSTSSCGTPMSAAGSSISSMCSSYSTAGWSRLPGPHDSRDSGVYSGSSQDYGESPVVEKALVFPVRFPGNGGGGEQRPSVPLSQLVRKLSEVCVMNLFAR